MRALQFLALLAWCLVLAWTSGPAVAGSFRAELKSGVEVVGEITDFREGYYQFQVGRETKRIRVEDLSSLSQVEPKSSTVSEADGKRKLAPEFTLLQKSGDKTSGRIVQFKEGYYDIANESGTVRIPVENVTEVTLAWQEEAAPDFPAPFVDKLSGTLRVRASPDAVEELVPGLLQLYAQASGQSGRWLPRHADGSQSYSVGQSTETENLRFEVRVDEPSAAISAVADGEADIAVIVEPPADEEVAPVVTTSAANAQVAAAATTAVDAEEAPSTETLKLAPAGAAVIVNPANPVEQLTYDQVAGIFSGKITDWSELGGPHRRIRVHTLARASGVFGIFKRAVLRDTELMLSAYQVESLRELVEIVSADPTAVGLTEAAIVGAAKPLSLVDSCGVTRAPDELSIKMRSYPLFGSFVVRTPVDADAKTREFRKFLSSDLTQGYLKSQGLPNELVVSGPSTTVNIAVAGETAEAAAVAQKMAEGTVERLSIAFSFKSGSTQPVAGSVEKIERLKSFLRNRDGEPREIAVVGFSDSVGNLESNIAISGTRARNVQALLASHGVRTEKVLSLGPSLPLACEKEPGGAELNRRVELWLY